MDWHAKGVDAGEGSHSLQEIAKIVAKKYHTIAAISGETDVISDGSRTALLQNGTPMFPKTTASGCLLSAICGAFLAVADKKETFAALIEAFTVYAVAGELAAQTLRPTQHGQFAVNLLDQLGEITPEQVTKRAKVAYV